MGEQRSFEVGDKVRSPLWKGVAKDTRLLAIGMDMNEQDKSMALAELMGERSKVDDVHVLVSSGENAVRSWHTYSNTTTGLAQFAAILLKFPEVMSIIDDYEESMWAYTSNQSDLYLGNRHKVRPTQANILDEILKRNGIEI